MCLYYILFFSCSKDKYDEPIEIYYLVNGNPINNSLVLNYPKEYGYEFGISGGYGNYAVNVLDKNVIIACIEDNHIIIKPLTIGTTKIIVSDKSDNAIVISISIMYFEQNFNVLNHNVHISGYVSEEQKKEITAKVLSNIPQIGGGYKFIYMDEEQTFGNCYIYMENTRDKAIEGTFTYIANGYSLIIGENTRKLLWGKFTRLTPPPAMAFLEDITLSYQSDYPKIELIYTSELVN